MVSARQILQTASLSLALAYAANANVLGPISGGSGSTAWNASAFNIVTLGVLAGNSYGATALAGNFSSGSDIAGGVAAFGNASSASTLTNGGVTNPYTDAFTTIVYGSNSGTSLKGCGPFYLGGGGSVQAVGCSGSGATGNPTTTASGLDFNFATARTSLESYSASTLTTAGTQLNYTTFTGGTIALSGITGPAYIDLNPALVANGGTVNITYNTSQVTAIIINVAGNISASSGFNVELNGTMLQNYSGQNGTGGNNFGGSPLLFNFYNAGTVTWSGNFYGSILAPFADVNAGGDLLGQGFFGQVESLGETHDDFFNGTGLPNTSLSATPEPMTFALFGSGLLAVGALRRKLKK